MLVLDECLKHFACFIFSYATKKRLSSPRATTTPSRMLWTSRTTAESLMTSARSAHHITNSVVGRYLLLIYTVNSHIYIKASLTFYYISLPQVKYRGKYINSLGTWKSIPDRPEFFFSRIVSDNVSDVSTFDLRSKRIQPLLFSLLCKLIYIIIDVMFIQIQI